MVAGSFRGKLVRDWLASVSVTHFAMTTTLFGYARCSTDKQDLAAQKAALEQLGVTAARSYTDHG